MVLSEAVESSNKEEPTKEEYWKEHINRQKASGLSRKDYCLEHKVHYKQFGYWERKGQRQIGSLELIPITIDRAEVMRNTARAETTLCTLVFKNGAVLKIHDKAVLGFLPVWS